MSRCVFRVSDRLILYTRAGCSLCEEMEAAVDGLLGGLKLEMCRVDVDADPVLKARFGWDVPLLFHGETELARHRLDPVAIRARLAGIA